MKQNNNEQIVFDMFEEVATKSIAEARNAYTYEEIDGCYQEAKEMADHARKNLQEKMGGTKKQNSHRSGSIGFTPSAITALL